MGLTDLPYTLFAEIITHLPPSDAVLCRRISKDACRALTRSDLSISLTLSHFPRSLEGRQLRRYLQDDAREALEQGDWAAVFAGLARRYFHLGNATPWRMLKVPVLKDEKRLRGVTPWNRFLSLNGKTAPFHHWDPVWTFAAKDGLLVYPTSAAGDIPEYRARDVETGLEFKIPFEMAGKAVRRVRLSYGILIFEWREEERHPLNDDEAAHDHFATAYDVRRTGAWDGIIPRCKDSAKATSSSWNFEFRSEWKINYLGPPLSHQDRFFSAHNSTHYAVYIWQPNRSPWDEDGPLERLIIWDIATPSSCRPSPGLSGIQKPEVGSGGAYIIRSWTNDQLRDWGIRQSETPSLRTLSLDECTWDSLTNSPCGHVFLTEEEHRWSDGPHSSPNRPRLHHVKTTGIPLPGSGPRWVDDCGGGGGVNLRFCWRGRWRQRMTEVDEDEDEKNGCSAAARVWTASETWPGRAPCWRHDDFPYVTVSEVFDAAAGVRIIARDCFMLETLSVYIRPKIRVQGVGRTGTKTTSRASRDERSGNSSRSSSSTHGSSSKSEDRGYKGARTEGPDGQEVQFADEMWRELMGKGFICGDERWLVGEDEKGDITILHF